MGEDTTRRLPDGDLGEILSLLRSIDGRLTAVETRLTGVETRLGKVEDEVYGLNRKVRVFSVDIVKLQDKDDDLEERINRMEAEQSR